MNRVLKKSYILLLLFITTVTTHLFSQKFKNTIIVNVSTKTNSSNQTGDITFSMSTGTPPYKIVVVNKDVRHERKSEGKNFTLNNVKFGTYSIAITDKNHQFYIDNIDLK